MRKIYITTMPDKAGAFLTASEAIAECGGNIVRTNYNKAVDTHTLFIEVDADEAAHERINAMLEDVEYLRDDPGIRQIILIEMKLRDQPGVLLPILRLIKNHEVNISYINSQENGTPYQYFKMGLLVEDTTEIKALLDDIAQVCEVRVLDYEASDRLLDSTVFNVTFANELRETLSLSQKATNELLSVADRMMQTANERGESPRATFEAVKAMARTIAAHKGSGYAAHTSTRELDTNLKLHTVEPACGSNVYVLEHHDMLLFVNCGLGCFEDELNATLSGLIPDYARKRKSVVVTDTDVDTAGMAGAFECVYLTRRSYEAYAAYLAGEPTYRDRHSADAPAVDMAKVVSSFEAPRLTRCAPFDKREGEDPLEFVGSLRFGSWTFDVLEGRGGHARGELVMASEGLGILFAGNLVTNAEGLSEDQRAFSALYPLEVSCSDVMPERAATVRAALKDRFAGYTALPGHGPALKL